MKSKKILKTQWKIRENSVKMLEGILSKSHKILGAFSFWKSFVNAIDDYLPSVVVPTMHIPLSIRLSVRSSARLSLIPSVRSFFHPTFYLSVLPCDCAVRPFVCLSGCPSYRKIVYFSVRLSLFPSVCLSMFPYVCPSVRSFVCLSFFPCIFPSFLW